MNPVLGFIGLGTMGLPMSGHLVRAGYRVLGFDPSPEAMSAATAQGLTACADAAAVGRQAQIVFTCLPSQKVVRATADALIASMAPGGVIGRLQHHQPAAGGRAGGGCGQARHRLSRRSAQRRRQRRAGGHAQHHGRRRRGAVRARAPAVRADGQEHLSPRRRRRRTDRQAVPEPDPGLDAVRGDGVGRARPGGRASSRSGCWR